MQISTLNFNNKLMMCRQTWIKLLIFFAIFVLGIDLIYKTYTGITYLNRESCILYASLPKWGFILYEYFVELMLIVIVGIFVATLIEKYFFRINRFVPGNTFLAFLYASIIPVCSCSVVPLIKATKEKIPFRVIITFVVAAPLLNPYIVVLSTTILGLKYAILRVISSFILAVGTGYITDFFYHRMMKKENLEGISGCGISGNCFVKKDDIYETTFAIFKKVLPFMIFAGALGVLIELSAPGEFLKGLNLSNNFWGTVMVILVGIPVYFCNGADVLFLQPLIKFSGLPLGTAMAFSLTSTSVCITSLAMLVKFLGKKLTGILLISVVMITFLLSFLIQLIH